VSRVPRVLYTDAAEFALPADADAVAAGAGVELVRTDGHEPDEIARAGADCDGVLLLRGRVDGALLDRLPHCRVLARMGAGYELIDVEAANERGIAVTNVPDFCTDEMAETVLLLVLAFARRLPALTRAAAEHRWLPLDQLPSPPRRVAGSSLGILGFGRSGQRTAERARGLGMRVLAWSRTRRDEALARTGAEAASFEAVMACDYVSVQVPLTPHTERLIDADALARMRPDGILINVARGRVVDEPALIQALGEGRIAGAGLDCTVEEPLAAASPLWDIPNVLITPHTAGETRRYEDNVIDLLLENLDRLWRGETELKNGIV
jgi:phosphoglycerate dehydrogenase-like enzyme